MYTKPTIMMMQPFMRWRKIPQALFVCVCFLVLMTGCATRSHQLSADVVLVNANVYTMTWADPDLSGRPMRDAPFDESGWHSDADAIALRGGLIVEVGSSTDIDAWIGSETKVIDLDGGYIVPGLVESHGHLHEIGEKAAQVNLIGTRKEEDIAARLKEAGDPAEGEWLLGSGWDEGEWADALPDRAFLDRMYPTTPVVLKGLRGFGTLGNAAALSAAGIDASLADPVGGTLVRRLDGSLSGVLLNNATDLLNDAIPAMTLNQRKRVLRYGMDRLMESGFVSTHHAGVRTDYLPVYEAMLEENELPMRVEVMLSAGVVGAPDVDAWVERGPSTDLTSRLQIRGIKAYYDGSLGSRGARLIDDYSDAPGERGVAGAEYGFDPDAVEAFMAAGFQAGIHAIGDQGNRDVLDFYERVLARNPAARGVHHRIEHAQIVHPDDLSRFGEMGIVASMEPGHAVEDSPWAEERVGSGRIKGAYAWRSLREGGALLLFNSDFTGTDWSFFYGMYAAITRKQKNGTPEGGWYPEESVTAEEALRAYTVWPARASGREAVTGTIEVGKMADLTVMDIDPLNTGLQAPDSLLEGRILMTIVDGEIVWSATLIE